MQRFQESTAISKIYQNQNIPKSVFLRGKGTQTKIEHVLCAVSKLSTHFEKQYDNLEVNCLRNSKMAPNLSRLSCFWVIDQHMQNIVLINISRTDWPAKILMPFLSFSYNLLQGYHTVFQKCVDNFEIKNKTCSHLVWGAFPP